MTNPRTRGLNRALIGVIAVTVLVFGMGACGSDSQQSQGTTGDKPAEFFDNYPCYRLK